MDGPDYVYAIYPFDESGNIAGVYVGLTHNLKRRLKAHQFGENPSQAEFHSFMRQYGFAFQVLEIIENYADRHLEYDWIDFFEKKTNLRIFNSKRGCFGADCENINGKSIGAIGNPVFAGGGVLWQLPTS